MSLPLLHLQQARHNKQFVTFLSQCHVPFKDWIVTACFYFSVHLSEALLYVFSPKLIQHSKDGKPTSFSFHAWRLYLVKEIVKNKKLSKDFWKICKNFHIQSNIARYLIKSRQSINMLADDYFNETLINDITQDLDLLEKEATPLLSHIKLSPDSRYLFLSKIKSKPIYYFHLIKSIFKRLIKKHSNR